jgi:NADH dehydrogenase
MFQKVVVCGAGFLGVHPSFKLKYVSIDATTYPGSNIAKSLMHVTTGSHARRVQISSRNPEKVHASLRKQGVDTGLLPSVPVDITISSSLVPAFEGADVVISLVGIMHGEWRFDIILRFF